MKQFQLTLFLFIFVTAAYTQQLKLSPKIELKVHSQSEQTDHAIYIQLPKSYGRLHSQFPVIVLLDAQDQTLFDYTSATIDRLMFTNDIPEAIFVGVRQNDRSKELSVERDDMSTANFQHFLETELTNLLQQKYQASNYFTFIGHSLGGQFVTNAMTTNPAFFKSIVSVSGALIYPPDYTFYHRRVLGRLTEFLIRNQKGSPFKQKYYFSAGAEGYQESGFKAGALSADSLLKRYPNKNLNWQFDFLPGFNHMTTPLQSIPAGLVFIFKDWHFAENIAMDVLLRQTTDPIDAINKQKEQIKNSYGVPLALPYSSYYQFARFYMQQGNTAKAQILSQEIISQYPDDEESYSLMAEILALQGDKPGAFRNYKLAESKSTPEKYAKEITKLGLK